MLPTSDNSVTQLTPDEFIQIWKGEAATRERMPDYYGQEPGPNGTTTTVVRLTNVEITGKVVIDGSDSPLMTLHLKGVVFPKLQLTNCPASQILISAKSRFDAIDLIGEKTQVAYLSCSDCQFHSLAIYQGATCNFITIESNAGEPNLAVEGPGTQLGYLKVLRAKLGLLELVKWAVVGEIDVDQSTIRHVKLHENSVVNNLQLSNHSICLALELESVTINERIRIDDSTVNYVWFQVKALLEATIRHATLQQFHYKTLASTTVNIVDSKLITFTLQHIRTGKDGLLQLINCQVNTLQFDTVLNLMSINIKDISPLRSSPYYKYSPCDPFDPAKGPVADWYEQGEFSGPTQINIFNADLGKLLFSSDLSGFDRFTFSNSKIIEMFIAGPRLPEVYTREGENADEQKRIAYNQIKRIYENRGDTITALKYQRLEMEIYRRQLRTHQEERIPGEQFQLLFNQLTNRHGTEWQIPMRLALAISLLGYVLYCVLLFGLDLDGTFRWPLIPYYFEFLNPAHKIDFLKKFDLVTNSWQDTVALLVDALCRIVVPLLLYQMVQAFRKYGKK